MCRKETLYTEMGSIAMRNSSVDKPDERNTNC